MGAGTLPWVSVCLRNSGWSSSICQLILPLPSRLSLHHEFDKSQSLFEPVTTLLSALFILGCLVAAVLCKRKWPLLSFFMVWYFLTLVIESSVLPLELIFGASGLFALYRPFRRTLVSLAILAKTVGNEKNRGSWSFCRLACHLRFRLDDL